MQGGADQRRRGRLSCSLGHPARRPLSVQLRPRMSALWVWNGVPPAKTLSRPQCPSGARAPGAPPARGPARISLLRCPVAGARAAAPGVLGGPGRWCSRDARCVAPDAAFRASRAVAGARAAVRLLLLTALARRGPACARAHGPWSRSAGDVGSQTVSAASRAGPPPRAGDRRPQEEAQRCGLRPGALGASQGRRRRARWSSGPCVSPPRPWPSPRGVQAAPAGGQRAPGSFLGDVSAADARGSSRDRRLRAEAGRARTASGAALQTGPAGSDSARHRLVTRSRRRERGRSSPWAARPLSAAQRPVAAAAAACPWVSTRRRVRARPRAGRNRLTAHRHLMSSVTFYAKCRPCMWGSRFSRTRLLLVSLNQVVFARTGAKASERNLPEHQGRNRISVLSIKSPMCRQEAEARTASHAPSTRTHLRAPFVTSRLPGVARRLLPVPPLSPTTLSTGALCFPEASFF